MFVYFVIILNRKELTKYVLVYHLNLLVDKELTP